MSTVSSNRPNAVEQSNSYYRQGRMDTETWAELAEYPDYRALLRQFDWTAFFQRFKAKDKIEILDCGCGLGHFPRMLADATLSCMPRSIIYDAVDPSAFSLNLHRASLSPPFCSRHSFQYSSQDFFALVRTPETYDIIWSIHSLYTVKACDLYELIRGIEGKLKQGGKAFIFLPRKDSAYIELYDAYRRAFHNEAIEEYLTANELEWCLRGRPKIKVG
jgi:SAM-dependent methyltransferase